MYSEKATKFCEIFPLLLTVCTVVKSKGKILQNFVAFSEYMNLTENICTLLKDHIYIFASNCTSLDQNMYVRIYGQCLYHLGYIIK